MYTRDVWYYFAVCGCIIVTLLAAMVCVDAALTMYREGPNLEEGFLFVVTILTAIAGREYVEQYVREWVSE